MKQDQVLAVIGAQWGDEGKGKLIDILAEDYDAVARCQGGANAGHTIMVRVPHHDKAAEKHVFHLVPSGILHPSTQAFIGSGVVVNLETLLEEIDALENAGVTVRNRLFISDRAHIVTEFHKEIDSMEEESRGSKRVGTTKRGIGPTYEDKAARVGIRISDLKDLSSLHEKLTQIAQHRTGYKFKATPQGLLQQYTKIADRVLPMVCDVSEKIDTMLTDGKSLLIEGANGTLLDLDHGTYPYVTSSNTVVGGACTGLGLAPKRINHVIGTVKAYTTRVGEGPFPTELNDEFGNTLREVGGEYGSTTGRPRRCGWIDIPIIKYAVRLNGIDSINLTKLDVLSSLDEIKIGVSYSVRGAALTTPPARLEDWNDIRVLYETFPGWKTNISAAKKFEDLPKNCQLYVEHVEKIVGVPIRFIGVGAEREQMITR